MEIILQGLALYGMFQLCGEVLSVYEAELALKASKGLAASRAAVAGTAGLALFSGAAYVISAAAGAV